MNLWVPILTEDSTDRTLHYNLLLYGSILDATPVTAPFSPASPSCSTSSGSSREGDEETGPKKPLVPYNGGFFQSTLFVFEAEHCFLKKATP